MHDDIPVTPARWLSLLNHELSSALCRAEGKDISFSQAVQRVGNVFDGIKKNNSRVWWVGNGGSAAVCSHLAQDLMNKTGIRSLFCGDISMMTCMANDFGYENVYSKPLEIIIDKGDLLIAISSSGNSENIVACTKIANERHAGLITLSGFEPGNTLWNTDSTVSFYVPSDLYGIVEVAHEAILHSIIECYYLNHR